MVFSIEEDAAILDIQKIKVENAANSEKSAENCNDKIETTIKMAGSLNDTIGQERFKFYLYR